MVFPTIAVAEDLPQWKRVIYLNSVLRIFCSRVISPALREKLERATGT
jgi:hypothetical protein